MLILTHSFHYSDLFIGDAWTKSCAAISHYVPKILPLPLARAKTGDEQFWKEKFHAANGKAQHAIMNDPVFFFLKRGGGGVEGVDKDFWVFSPCFQCVPVMFPSSSQNVPRCIPQDVPNNTWVLSHLVCPKFNSPVYEL